MKFVVLVLLGFASMAWAKPSEVCELLLGGGYSQLGPDHSLESLRENFPDSPLINPHLSTILFRVEGDAVFRLQTWQTIANLAKSLEVEAPVELAAVGTSNQSPPLYFTAAGDTERLLSFMEALPTALPKAQILAGLGLHEQNMIFVNGQVDSQMMTLTHDGFPGLMESQNNISTGPIQLLNNPELGLFFVSLPYSRYEAFVNATPPEFRHHSTPKKIVTLPIETLTYEDLERTLTDLPKGEVQIQLTRGGDPATMLITVFDLSVFQKLHTQLSARLGVPLVRLTQGELDGILDLVKITPARAPSPVFDGTLTEASRSLRVSQIFNEGLFREFYVAGSPYEMTPNAPSVVVKTYSRPILFLISAEAVARMSLEELNTYYREQTGYDLPEVTRAVLAKYKEYPGSIERGLHGQLWSQKGDDLFTSVRESQRPFLIVGELGERTIKEGARPRFLILPIPEPKVEAAAVDPEVLPDVKAADILGNEDLWEDVIMHLFVGEPVIDLEAKRQRLQTWLRELKTSHRYVTGAQHSLANEWKTAVSESLPGNLDAGLVAALQGIAEFILLEEAPQASQPASAAAETSTDLLSLLHKPDSASDTLTYNLVTLKQEQFSVTLSKSVVREVFHDKGAQRSIAPAFIRALRHGFIGAGEKSGIKRLTNLAQNMIEVKIPGSMSQARLIGCMEAGPTIKIYRLIYKGGQSSGGFERYKHLCDGGDAPSGK